MKMYSKLCLIITMIFTLTSCKKQEVKYPLYSLETVEYIPDSLKAKHREWIKETVRAASQHMTGGDYEDVDETIIQAERTANRIFSSEIIGLRKKIDEDYFNDVILKPSEFNSYEEKVLDSLTNK